MIKLNVEMIRQLGEKFTGKDSITGLQKVQTIMDSLYKYMDEEFIKAVKKDKSLTRFIITLGYRDRLKLVYNSKTRLIFLENKNITNYENSIRRPINKVVLPNVEFGMKNVIYLQDIVYPVCKILWNECVKRNDYCIGHVSHLDKSSDRPTEIVDTKPDNLNTRDKYQLSPVRRTSASEIIKLAKEKKDPILNTMLQRKSHDEEFKRTMVEQFKNKAEERARNITDSYNKSKEDNDYVLSRSIELFKGMGDECIDHLDLVEITNNNCYSKRPGFKNIFMSLTSGFLDKTLFNITEKDGIITNIKMKNEKGFISTYEETIEIIERNLTQIFKITCYLDKRNPYLPYVVYTTLDDTNMRNICMVEVFNNTRQNDRLLMAEYTVIKGEFKPSLLNYITDYRDTRFNSVYKTYRSTNDTRTPQITNITYKSNGARLTHDLKSGRIIMNDIERETNNIMNKLSEEVNK